MPKATCQQPAGFTARVSAAESGSLSRGKPLSVKRGLGMAKHDGEGRVLSIELAGESTVLAFTLHPKYPEALNLACVLQLWAAHCMRQAICVAAPSYAASGSLAGPATPELQHAAQPTDSAACLTDG